MSIVTRMCNRIWRKTCCSTNVEILINIQNHSKEGFWKSVGRKKICDYLSHRSWLRLHPRHLSPVKFSLEYKATELSRKGNNILSCVVDQMLTISFIFYFLFCEENKTRMWSQCKYADLQLRLQLGQKV